MNLSFLSQFGFAKANEKGIFEMPFIDRMGFVFIICIIAMVIISIYQTRNGVKANGLEIESKMFKTSPGFLAGAIIILGILAALYTLYY